MRVKYLYIFGFQSNVSTRDQESRNSMAGLFTKYGGRCGPTATIWIEENNTVVEKSLGEIPLKIPAREQLPEKKPTEKYEREVGIYAVCHGITPGNDIAGGIERVVAAFKEVLPDEQRVAVNKIALVQCFAAAAATVAKEGLFGDLKPHTEYVGKVLVWDDLKDADDASDLLRLTALLHQNGMRPMLTGWEAYVGVYPSGKKQLVKKYNPSSRISTYMPVREQDRTGNKRKRHVYQVNEEGMLLMDFEGWSDKKSTTS